MSGNSKTGARGKRQGTKGSRAGPKTRGKAGKEAEAQGGEEAQETGKKLQGDPNPVKLFILPKDVDEGARIVTLENPATGKNNRYFVCPEKGVYEFTRVSAPTSSPRSWLIARHSSEPQRIVDETGERSKYFQSSEDALQPPLSSGYVAKNPHLFVATPMDPLFILLPILSLASTSAKGAKQMFLTFDDHLDAILDSNRHCKWIFRHERLRSLAAERLNAVCDTVEAGDEIMYRISTEKLLNELLSKARRMVEKGLPASLEERFVRQALQKPMLAVKSNAESQADVKESSEATPVAETQSSTSDLTTTDSISSMESQVSTAATSITPESEYEAESKPILDPPTIDAPDGIPKLLRLRVALDFILSSYISPHLRTTLNTHLTTTKTIDFTPLITHLVHLSDLRKEAIALRSLTTNVNRKRGLEEDEEVVAAREEKKRRKEEEERRKKSESRGVRELKKVDVSGMKKLSSFFAVKPKEKKG